MKKTIRNLMAICFALVLVAGILPMYAQALSESDTGAISIAGLDEEVEIAVYKLMEVNYDDTADQPVDPAFVWVSAVANWVETNYPTYIDASTGAVTEEFAQLSSDTTGYGTDLATFYDKMAKAIKAGDVTVAVAATATGNGNIEGLAMGNYLVLIENGMKIYRPSTVNLIPVWDETEEKWAMSTANVVIKSSDPSVKKEMAIADAATDANDVKVGDTVDYTVTADIPVYPANALAKGYQIGDDLPDGITLDATSIKVYGVNEGEADTELTSGYTLTTAAGTKTANDTAVDFLLDFTYEQIRGYASVKVEYSATINENVVLGTSGNTNTAYLDYNNNPYSDATWKEKTADGATVYSFGIEVTKQDEQGNALTGAEFSLSASDAANAAAYTFKQNSDGSYTLAEGTDSSAVLAVDENGKLFVRGLVPGTYYLTETKAPDGYVKLQSAVEITITESTATQGAVVVTADTGTTEDNSGVVKATVTNVEGFSLPVTGGAGTMLFSIVGVLLMGMGVMVVSAGLKTKRTR